MTIGTHPEQFDRLIRQIDQIAPQIKEKIIIQRGFTKYIPKHCESFDFAPSLEPYFSEARIVITHAATSVLEFVMKYKKPVIVVPRQKKFHEHLNDHQVDFAVYFENKTGTKAILNIEELTPNLLTSYKIIPIFKKEGVKKLQAYFKKIFAEINFDLKNEKAIRK